MTHPSASDDAVPGDVAERALPGRDETFALRDGRRLTVRHFGAPLEQRRGPPIIALHGTPGSRFKYVPVHRDALARGLSLIAVDRWGYGGTDAPAARTLSRFAADIEELTDQLGLDRVSVIGISGGGPYATACGVCLPDRVARVALVAPVGLVTSEGGHVAQLSPFHRFCFRLLPLRPRAVRGIFAVYRRILHRSPRLAISLAMARSGQADRQMLQDKTIVAGLAAMMRTGLDANGPGPEIDLSVFRGPWDFDPSRLQCPTRIWFGDQDGSVPLGAIEALRNAAEPVELIHVPGQGHFWAVTPRFSDVLDWLAEADGSSSSSG